MIKNYKQVGDLIADLIGQMVAEQTKGLQGQIREEVARQFDAHDLPPTYITRKQACEALGVSVPTLHKMMNDGVLTFVKIGRSTRFPKDEFEAALRAGKLRKYGRRGQ